MDRMKLENYQQKSLFDPDQRIENSISAHESVKPLKEGYHAKILAVMEKCNTPLTFREIASIGGLPDGIWRRMGELVELNKIEVCGSKIDRFSTRSCSLYKLKK